MSIRIWQKKSPPIFTKKQGINSKFNENLPVIICQEHPGNPQQKDHPVLRK